MSQARVAATGPMNALKIGVEVYFSDHGIFPSVDRSPIISDNPNRE
jgi:hypothetical protein